MSSPVAPRLAPLLILALDGATFDVIRPMAAAGRLPNLASWMASAGHDAAYPLPSTLPPVTFPAWSTFMTGLDPGEHGVFDFTQKLPGAYRLRFANSSDRHGESFFQTVSRAGGRVLVLGLPATYPPEAVSGLLVPGFDAPVSAGSDAEATSDPDLYRRVEARAGPWMRPDLDEGARGAGFHERAVGTLLGRIERKTKFALAALEEMRNDADGARPDLALVVFSESDTVGHHYFRDHDPMSPRHDPGASRTRRDAIARVYERLDSACGELRRGFGEDARCVVVSDHGMGAASRYIVHLNRHLADRGLLTRRRGFDGSDVARRLRDAAVSWLPPSLAQALFRRARASAAHLESRVRFGGFDWSRTLAFSEEANTQPGVWINLEGREVRGCVTATDYEGVRDRVIDALLDWKLPSGDAVIARAVRREDVYRGPFIDRAPDVVVELGTDRGYGLSLVPTPWKRVEGRGAIRMLADHELAGGRGRGMNGTHRRDGIFISAPGVGSADAAIGGAHLPDSIVDVAPYALRSMGLAGESIGISQDAETEDMDSERAPLTYTDEEDDIVAARLRALGYLE